eukprot:1778295-Pyramimonas_sp.AAC.1
MSLAHSVKVCAVGKRRRSGVASRRDELAAQLQQLGVLLADLAPVVVERVHVLRELAGVVAFALSGLHERSAQ